MDLASIPKQIAYARLGYGAAALLTPKLAITAVGGKPSQMTPAAMAWAGAFASREAALGAMTLGSGDLDPATRRKVMLLNAAVDTVDAVVFIALAKRQRSILPLILALPAGVMSIVGHIQAARELSGAPDAAGTPYENAYATA
jgi:hypothetical protein